MNYQDCGKACFSLTDQERKEIVLTSAALEDSRARQKIYLLALILLWIETSKHILIRKLVTLNFLFEKAKVSFLPEFSTPLATCLGLFTLISPTLRGKSHTYNTKVLDNIWRNFAIQESYTTYLYKTLPHKLAPKLAHSFKTLKIPLTLPFTLSLIYNEKWVMRLWRYLTNETHSPFIVNRLLNRRCISIWFKGSHRLSSLLKKFTTSRIF